MGHTSSWSSFCSNILLTGSMAPLTEVHDLMDRSCCKGWGKARLSSEEGGKMQLPSLWTHEFVPKTPREVLIKGQFSHLQDLTPQAMPLGTPDLMHLVIRATSHIAMSALQSLKDWQGYPYPLNRVIKTPWAGLLSKIIQVVSVTVQMHVQICVPLKRPIVPTHWQSQKCLLIFYPMGHRLNYKDRFFIPLIFKPALDGLRAIFSFGNAGYGPLFFHELGTLCDCGWSNVYCQVSTPYHRHSHMLLHVFSQRVLMALQCMHTHSFTHCHIHAFTVILRARFLLSSVRAVVVKLSVQNHDWGTC